MFDKWKTKKALCKAFNFYRQKKEMCLLRFYNPIVYGQLEEIEYAIAYVLCEYFDFKCDNPWSYKWYITYDYTKYYNECKIAYEKITEQNNTMRYNYIAHFINGSKKSGYMEGDIIYNTENGCLYTYDGNNFINMC